VQGAAHAFIFELYANRSAEHPEGIVSPETLASFFGVSVCDDRAGSKDLNNYGYAQNNICGWNPFVAHGHLKCDDTYVAAGKHGHRYKYVSPLALTSRTTHVKPKQQVGHERIPDHWCKRSSNITLDHLNGDLVQDLIDQPFILSHLMGGNLGQTNTYEPIDINAYTSGLYPSYDFLLKDYNYACLGLFQAVFDAKVPWLDRMYVNSSDALRVVLDQVPLFAYLNCPQLKGPFDSSLFNKFPGWNRSQSWGDWQ
jgi:hypothetical protein